MGVSVEDYKAKPLVSYNLCEINTVHLISDLIQNVHQGRVIANLHVLIMLKVFKNVIRKHF